MPGYASAERKFPKEQRAKKLVGSAQELVMNRWSGKSWADVTYSAMGSTANLLKVTSGIGVKIAVNTASGGLFGAIGQSVATYADGAGYGPDQLARKISDGAIEYIWPLIEDKIKEFSEDTFNACGAKAVEMAAAPEIASSALNKARESFKKHPIDEVAERMQKNVAAMVLRTAALNSSLTRGQISYCDNIYDMGVELYQIDATRSEVIADAEHLRIYAEQISKLAREIKPREIQREIRALADKAVQDGTIPHYNSYSWNVVGRAQQCSEAHCWGPHTDKL